MVKIISEGATIALCDAPHYIRLKAETGAYVGATQEDAQGIAVLGEPYNLPGHTEITRVALKNEETGETETVIAPEAYAVEVDGGEMIVAGMNEVNATTGDALCELDAGLEDVKDALCEIDGILEGGN